MTGVYHKTQLVLLMSSCALLVVLMEVTLNVYPLTKSVMTIWIVLEERMNHIFATVLPKEMSVWLAETHHWRGGWNTAEVDCGELCVMTLGIILMQPLYVVNLE